MKNELKFEQMAQFKILNIVFHMFKYGVDDEDKKLMVISSSPFKEMFNAIRQTYLNSMPQVSDGNNQSTVEYIEDRSFEFEIMKGYLDECKKGIMYFDDFSWNSLDDANKRDYIINLASPFSIKEETIVSLLSY